VASPRSNVVSADLGVVAFRDRLDASPYDEAASEFIRFRDDSNDDVVGSVVRSLGTLDDDAREEFRRTANVDVMTTLRLFAMRRTLQARRRASLSLALEALDAFALLPAISDVPWESWLKAALFVARSLGADLEATRRRFEDLAHGDTAARFDVAAESMKRVQDLETCHVAEVTTTYGTGFVETLVFRGAPSFGPFGAPSRLGNNEIEFRPTTNLAQLSASLADAFDATDKVVSSPIGQDQLVATTFSLAVPGSYVPSAGCLSFVADGSKGSPSFTVFAAELLDDENVKELAEAANENDDQSALYDGKRLVVMSALPSFDEDGEAEDDLGEFVTIARGVLTSPTAATWSAR
jgi:hypothetical protein